MDQAERYLRARLRVKELKGFYVHVAVFVVINLMLGLMNLMTSPGSLWFQWPLLGWGLGLALHGLVVFGIGSALGRGWEARKLRELTEGPQG